MSEAEHPRGAFDPPLPRGLPSRPGPGPHRPRGAFDPPALGLPSRPGPGPHRTSGCTPRMAAFSNRVGRACSVLRPSTPGCATSRCTTCRRHAGRQARHGGRWGTRRCSPFAAAAAGRDMRPRTLPGRARPPARPAGAPHLGIGEVGHGIRPAVKVVLQRVRPAAEELWLAAQQLMGGAPPQQLCQAVDAGAQHPWVGRDPVRVAGCADGLHHLPRHARVGGQLPQLAGVDAAGAAGAAAAAARPPRHGGRQGLAARCCSTRGLSAL